MSQATVWTSRGQLAEGALPQPLSLEGELPPTRPHSFTLCPHYAALAPLPIANACGATTTSFLNLKGQKVTTPTHTKRNRGFYDPRQWPGTDRCLLSEQGR
jgi:hypothetical protein